MTDNQPKKPDLYRDTLVRYLGYANEVGESFKSLIPKSAYLSTYAISIAYVSADTLDKSENLKKKLTAADVFIWQMLASVIVPGFTINRICHFSRLGLMRSSTSFRNYKYNKYIVSGIGLGSIPLIVKPIDHSIDYIMDESFRKYVGKE